MWLRYAIPLQKIHPLAEVVPPKSYEAENSPRRSEIKWCPTSLHLHLVCVCVGGGVHTMSLVLNLWYMLCIFQFNNDLCFWNDNEWRIRREQLVYRLHFFRKFNHHILCWWSNLCNGLVSTSEYVYLFHLGNHFICIECEGLLKPSL